MTSIPKTARVALAVAVLALATAGAASADAFHPDPFQSEGAPADVYHPDPFQSTGIPAGSSWSSVDPGAIREWDYSRPATARVWSHAARLRPNGSGCYPRCMI